LSKQTDIMYHISNNSYVVRFDDGSGWEVSVSPRYESLEEEKLTHYEMNWAALGSVDYATAKDYFRLMEQALMLIEKLDKDIKDSTKLN
jgi:hypothetical protein